MSLRGAQALAGQRQLGIDADKPAAQANGPGRDRRAPGPVERGPQFPHELGVGRRLRRGGHVDALKILAVDRLAVDPHGVGKVQPTDILPPAAHGPAQEPAGQAGQRRKGPALAAQHDSQTQHHAANARRGTLVKGLFPLPAGLAQETAPPAGRGVDSSQTLSPASP